MEKNVAEYRAFKEGQRKIPEHLAIRKEKTGVLFENKFLERITRTNIYTPVITHALISSGLFWFGLTHLHMPWHVALITFGCGIIFWTFAEYCVHRFLYHTETNSKFLYNLQYKAHGIHHQFPIDPARLAMPPLPGIILSAVFFLIFWLIGRQLAFTFFPGFMLGYILYISIHYAQHRIKPPKYRPWKLLWKHHHIHHYIDPYKAHGVSTRFWDWVFGTMPGKKRK